MKYVGYMFSSSASIRVFVVYGTTLTWNFYINSLQYPSNFDAKGRVQAQLPIDDELQHNAGATGWPTCMIASSWNVVHCLGT
jgi:hypothetical protein